MVRISGVMILCECVGMILTMMRIATLGLTVESVAIGGVMMVIIDITC